jgi:hypothetical protein
MRRNLALLVVCGLALAAGVAPTASSAGDGYELAVLVDGVRVFEGTATFTSATVVVVYGSGADLGSWARATGLQATVTKQGTGEVVTYRVVDAWPSAAPAGLRGKPILLTLSTTNP